MTQSASPSSSPGRRTAAKLQVRTAIRHEALALFREHGFETVTTVEIARRAGVAQRTLFRHYETKYAILFDGMDEVALFEEVLKTEMAAAASSREAVRRAHQALAIDYDHRAAEFREVYAIIRGCAPLHATERQRHARIDELLAQALDGPETLFGNLPPSLPARVAAGAVMGFIRPVIRAWLWQELDGTMQALARRAWPEISLIIDRTLAYGGDLLATSEGASG